MEQFRFIDDASVLKALAHPMRLRLLNSFIEHEASVQQLAFEFNEVHAKLFYHVKELEKHNLITPVREQIKNGISERFYRAVARRFVLGSTIGEGPELVQQLEETAHAEVLKWHRSEILKVNHQVVAEALVKDSLCIKPGEKVIVEGTSYQQDLLKAVVVQCRAVGAEAYVRLMDQDMLLDMLNSLTPEQLRYPAPLTEKLTEVIDYWVSFDAVSSSRLLSSVPAENLQALIDSEAAILKPGQKRYANIVVGYPTPDRARELSIDYPTLHDSFWKAMSVTQLELHNRGRHLVHLLGQGGEFEITGAGTSLRFSTDVERPVMVHSGRLQPNFVSSHSPVDLWLPAGQVSFAPLEETINGRIFVPRITFRGESILGVAFIVENGCIVSSNAASNKQLLDSMLRLAGHSKIGLIAFGINPCVTQLTGYKYLDPIAEGAATLTLGGNKHLGGNIAGLIPVSFSVPHHNVSPV